MIVPASSEEKVQFGVESIVGVVTAVTPAITGAVVSVTGAVVSVTGAVVSVVDSSSSLQEMMVRLKRDMRIMYKTLFIFVLHL